MKKFLISAASIAVLTTGVAAHADYNYVGLGLGWTMGRAEGKQGVVIANQPYNSKKRATDTSAFSGNLFLGHEFSAGNGGFLLEAKIGKDSSNTTAKNIIHDTDNETYGENKISLKRKFSLALGVGYAQEVLPETRVYGKISAVLSKFQLQNTIFTSDVGGGVRPGKITRSHKKLRTALGFAPTIGVARSFGNFSVSLDYTCELYKKLKISGLVGNTGTNADGFSTTIKPVYHTVMLGISTKI